MIWYYIVTCVLILGVTFLLQKRCRHIWKTHAMNDVVFENKAKKIASLNTLEWLICQSCGEVVVINRTNGAKKVICKGGSAVKTDKLFWQEKKDTK